MSSMCVQLFMAFELVVLKLYVPCLVPTNPKWLPFSRKRNARIFFYIFFHSEKNIYIQQNELFEKSGKQYFDQHLVISNNNYYYY